MPRLAHTTPPTMVALDGPVVKAKEGEGEGGGKGEREGGQEEEFVLEDGRGAELKSEGLESEERK